MLAAPIYARKSTDQNLPDDAAWMERGKEGA